MKNRDLFRLHEGFNKVKDLPGVRFAVAVARNSRTVADYIADLEKAKEPTEAFQAVQQAEVDMMNAHAERGEDGLPIMVGPGAFRVKEIEAYQAARAALFEDHKEAIKAREAQMAEYEKLLDEDCGLELRTVKESDLPESITAEMFAMIAEMVE